MADRAESSTSSTEPRYPVRVVTRRTGLTPDVLRAWERRYGVVTPRRSAGGQRLYSEADVQRLRLLQRAAAAGHSIGEVARLDSETLEHLIREGIDRDSPTREAQPSAATVDAIQRQALAAVERMDDAMLESVLKRAALTLTSTALLDHLIAPLLYGIGDRWHAGSISPAHEHLASATIRRVLTWVVEAYGSDAGAPRLVVGTTTGELHELGAMLVAATAAEERWRVTYLGPSLPAEHIARAAAQVGAAAVALSVVNVDRGHLLQEVRRLVRTVPEGVAIVVGGSATAGHESELTAEGVRVLEDMAELRRALRELAAGRSDGGSELTDEGSENGSELSEK